MKYYVRCFSPGNWLADAIDELSGDAICVDWNCANGGATNEWSFFEIESDGKKKSRALDMVVRRLLVANLRKTMDGVDFYFEQPANLDPARIVEDSVEFGTKHVSLSGVCYAVFQKEIKGAFRKRGELVHYSKKDIANLLLSIRNDVKENSVLDEIIRLYQPNIKVPKFRSKLDSSFFPGTHTMT